MKHVFPTREVTHLWAHQAQDNARNAAGNVYFKGPTIYSYRDSWPMARIYAHSKRGTLVLCNSERASVTTAKHQGWVAMACRHLPSVQVPNVETRYWAGRAVDKDEHAANLAHFAGLITEHLAKSKRAMQARSVEWRHGVALDAWHSARRYIEFFGIRRKLAAFPVDEFRRAQERAQSIESPDPVRDAKRIKEREKRAAKERAELQAIFDTYCADVAAYNAAILAARANWAPFDPVQEWRDTGKWRAVDEVVLPADVKHPHLGETLPWREARRMRQRIGRLFDLPRIEINGGRHHYTGPVLLRVDGQEIETSEGARIPLEHAPRIWRLVQACRASGRPYARNGHTEHAGPYAIDAVTVEGELRAGCHTIPYAELERMADQLGLTDEAARQVRETGRIE